MKSEKKNDIKIKEDEIIKLYTKGISLRKITEKVKISRYHLYYILGKYRIPMSIRKGTYKIHNGMKNNPMITLYITRFLDDLGIENTNEYIYKPFAEKGKLILIFEKKENV